MSKAQVMRLGDIAKIRSGFNSRGKLPIDPRGELEVIQLKNITSDGLGLDGSFDKISTDKDADLLKNDDILFAGKGTRITAIHIKNVDGPTICSSAFFRIRFVCTNNDVVSSFVAWQLNQTKLANYFTRLSTGERHLTVKKKVLEDASILLPEISIQQQFGTLLDSLELEKQLFEQLKMCREDQLMLLSEKLDSMGEV